MIKRIAFALLALMALITLLVPAQGAQALSLTTGVIVGDNIALRSAASSSGKLLTRLDEGTVVAILESNVNSEWHRVTAGKRTGYVNRMYVNINTSLPSYQLSYTGTVVNCNTDINVRQKPAANAKKLGVALKGASLNVTQAFVSSAWHEVEYEGGIGYVSVKYIALSAKVNDDQLSNIVVEGGTLSPVFSPTEYGYIVTATQEQVLVKAEANKGVKVSIGSTGVASAKYTIRSGNSKTIRISVDGKVRYTLYLVRDVLTVGTWNIKRCNDNAVMQGWLIGAQNPDILGVQEVYQNSKENVNNLYSIRTRRSQNVTFAATINYASGGRYGIGQVSRYKPVSEEQTALHDGGNEPRCVQKVVYEIDGKKVSVYNTHFSYESATVRKKQFAAVLALMDKDTNPYKILTGDFNAQESEFGAFKKNYKIVNTSDTKFYDYAYKRIAMSQIDNIIVSKSITVLNARAIPTKYSDHYPLFAFLALK